MQEKELFKSLVKNFMALAYDVARKAGDILNSATCPNMTEVSSADC